MKWSRCLQLAGLTTVYVVGCAATERRSSAPDLIHDPFHESKAEIRELLIDIINDVETANVQGLRDGHLNSDKFTKFGGQFERINIDECNEGEAAIVTSVEDLKLEMKDLKIDVFGDVAIVTCYNHFSYKDNGGREQRVARNTLVFL